MTPTRTLELKKLILDLSEMVLEFLESDFSDKKYDKIANLIIELQDEIKILR